VTEFFADGLSPSMEQILRWATSCRDIRYALSVVDECRNVEELANVMVSAIAGVASTDELRQKFAAFGSGVALLSGPPVPCPASFNLGTA